MASRSRPFTPERGDAGFAVAAAPRLPPHSREFGTGSGPDQQRWDIVVNDEAHKCSAYTERSSGPDAHLAPLKWHEK